MLYLITGASGSGKSEYAERLACDLAREDKVRYKLYVATMESQSRQAKERIARHKAQREGKGFVTVESLYGLPFSGAEKESPWGKYPLADSVILLECLSNLLANLMFSGGMNGEQAAARIFSQAQRARRLCRHLVIVTNEIFSDGLQYARETQDYVRALAMTNRLLAGEADGFWEVVYSVPLCLKGDKLWQF